MITSKQVGFLFFLINYFITRIFHFFSQNITGRAVGDCHSPVPGRMALGAACSGGNHMGSPSRPDTMETPSWGAGVSV